MKVRTFRNESKGTPWAHKLAVGCTVCGQACIERDGGPIHVGTHPTICYETPTKTYAKQEIMSTLEREPKFKQQSTVSREITYYELTPRPNNFVVQETFPEVYQITDRDNEATMSIEDKRIVEIMESGIHKNQTGHWEIPLPLRSCNIIFQTTESKWQLASKLCCVHSRETQRWNETT